MNSTSLSKKCCILLAIFTFSLVVQVSQGFLYDFERRVRELKAAKPDADLVKIEAEAVKELQYNIGDLENFGPFPGGQIQHKGDGFDLDISFKHIMPSSAIKEMKASQVKIDRNSSSVFAEIVSENPLVISGLCKVNRGITPYGTFDGSGSCSFKLVKLVAKFNGNYTSGHRYYPGVDDLNMTYSFSDLLVLHYPALTFNGDKKINQELFSAAVKVLVGFVSDGIETFGKPLMSELLDRSFRYVEGFYDAVSTPLKRDEL